MHTVVYQIIIFSTSCPNFKLCNDLKKKINHYLIWNWDEKWENNILFEMEKISAELL